jgi:CO/xanthine dehydrogenase FAD-binding subunit
MAITCTALPSTWVHASPRTSRAWAPRDWPMTAWSKLIDATADLFGNGAEGTTDNTLANGERIMSITPGAPLPRERAIYRRVIRRASAEWPLVEVVVRVVIDNAQFQFVRLTAGGVAPVPLRFERVESALQSRLVDGAAIKQAASLAVEGAVLFRKPATNCNCCRHKSPMSCGM